jgi:hypothetical protein
MRAHCGLSKTNHLTSVIYFVSCHKYQDNAQCRTDLANVTFPSPFRNLMSKRNAGAG